MSSRKRLIRRRDMIPDDDVGLEPYEVPIRQRTASRQPIFIEEEEENPSSNENPYWSASSEDSLTDLDDLIDDTESAPKVERFDFATAIYDVVTPRKENMMLAHDDFLRYQARKQSIQNETKRTTLKRKVKVKIPIWKNPMVATAGEREDDSTDDGDATSEGDYDIQPTYVDEPDVVDRDPKGKVLYDSDYDYDPDEDSDEPDEEDKPEVIPMSFYDEKCKEKERVRELYDYQVLPANLIKSGRNKSMMLIYGTGSGKTLAAFTLINAMMKREREEKEKTLPTQWIIVVPPGLYDQWESEMREDQLCNVFKNGSQELFFLNYYRARVKLRRPQEFVTKFLKDEQGMKEVQKSYVLVDEVQNYRYTSNISTSNFEQKRPKRRTKAAKKLSQIIDLTNDDEEEEQVDEDNEEEGGVTQESGNKAAQKLTFVGAVSHAKSCFFITATPITGNISDMATYLWMMQKKSAVPTTMQLDEIARMIVKAYMFAIAPPDDDKISSLALTRFEKESPAARRHLQETAMREMWKCYFLFNEARQTDDATPIARTHYEYCPFEEAEEANYIEAKTSKQNHFKLRSTAASNSDTKMIKMVKIVTEKLRDPNARILIVSRNVSKSQFGTSRVIPFLEKASIPFMDITSSGKSLKKAQIIAFNERKPQLAPRTKKKKGEPKPKIKPPPEVIEPQRVLLIGPASSVGTDFKGITCVILMEPSWREPTTEQIIGRAVRTNAHKYIPRESSLYNKVEVYRMVSVRSNFRKDHLALINPRDQESNPIWLEILAHRLRVTAGIEDANANYLNSSIINQAVLAEAHYLEDSEDLIEMENNTGDEEHYLGAFTTDQIVLADGYNKWQEASRFLQILRRIQVEKDCVTNKLPRLMSDPVEEKQRLPVIKLEKK
jgi:hypothetical protein